MYLKLNIDEKYHEVLIEDDKIFTKCPGCMNEVKVDPQILREVLQEGATFESVTVTCPDCYGKKGA